MNLYELTQEQIALSERAEAGEDVATLLDAAEGAVEQKIEHCVYVVRELETLADAAKAEAKRLSERAAAKQNAADRLREWIAFNMSVLGMKKQQTPIGTVTFVKPKQRIEVDTAAIIDWPQDVYDVAVRTEYVVNKKILKDEFEARLPTLLGVKIVDGKPSISIR